MFYSHEVLTSRKYGVATVWLAATLGSKSQLKKLSRKAILDVDVGKACETIGHPEAPMALRLQSNLMYGVARVYGQQCGYVLNDAETARNNLRAVFKVMRASALDVEGGSKARADQLMLPDDPNFLPDLELLPLDLDNLDQVADQTSQRSASLLSPRSSQATTAPLQDIGGLIIPGSASSFFGGPVGGGLGSLSVRGDSGAGTRVGSGLFQREQDGLLEDDLGLVIGEDGNMQFEEPAPARQARAPSGRVDRTDNLSVRAEEQVHHDGSSAQPARNLFMQPNDDGFVPTQEDDYMAMPDVQPAPAGGQQITEDQQSTASETADAPQRRRQRAGLRIIPLDNTMELHSADLQRWNQQYVQNMQEAIRHKQGPKLAAIAKKNAEHWMLATSDRGPLNMFTGIRLLESLTGMKLTSGGEKRPRDDPAGSDDSRRVRSRGEPSSDEQGRGLAFNDDGYMPMMDDMEIEQGREQPTPLDDRHHSSVFPWNQSTGSRRPTGVFSQGGTSGAGALPLGGMISRRGSRLTSASPLVGRGIDISDEDIQLPGSATALGEEDFELFGPAANVDTQTAAQSQWLRTVLDGESANFLEFVKAGIEEQDELRGSVAAGDEEDERVEGSIAFEQLLPPESNSCVVAAQALLHVLTLGTKNALQVQQEEAFGSINLRILAA